MVSSTNICALRFVLPGIESFWGIQQNYLMNLIRLGIIKETNFLAAQINMIQKCSRLYPEKKVKKVCCMSIAPLYRQKLCKANAFSRGTHSRHSILCIDLKCCSYWAQDVPRLWDLVAAKLWSKPLKFMLCNIVWLLAKQSFFWLAQQLFYSLREGKNSIFCSCIAIIRCRKCGLEKWYENQYYTVYYLSKSHSSSFEYQ